MNKVDFVIPAKPRLVRVPDAINLHGGSHAPPPPLRITKGAGGENFSRNSKRRKLCTNTKVSGAPPHTKFTVIPSRAITDPRINTRKPLLLLLGAIGIHASAHGICYPSQRRLAVLCGKSLSWAHKYLHELIRLGYLRRLIPPRPQRKRSALRLQVMWSVTQPLPPKELEWVMTPWCWR
jgi:hypothetical protein